MPGKAVYIDKKGQVSPDQSGNAAGTLFISEKNPFWGMPGKPMDLGKAAIYRRFELERDIVLSEIQMHRPSFYNGVALWLDNRRNDFASGRPEFAIDVQNLRKLLESPEVLGNEGAAKLWKDIDNTPAIKKVDEFRRSLSDNAAAVLPTAVHQTAGQRLRD